jgi:hypothetical protein
VAGREWAFRTGEASAVATKSKQGMAMANAVVTFLIVDGTNSIKSTCTGKPAQWLKTIAESMLYGNS